MHISNSNRAKVALETLLVAFDLLGIWMNSRLLEKT